MRQYNLGFAWALLWALAGCGGGGSTEAPPGSDDPPPVSEIDPEGAQPAKQPTGLPETADELKPRIFPMGGGPNPVRSAVIHFDRPVFPENHIGRAPEEGTVVTVTPPVDVTARITSRTTLEVTPTTGFAPGTSYQVALASIASEGRTLSSSRWVERFETESLNFTQLAMGALDPKTRKLRLELQFNGPVQRADLKNRVTVSIDGAPARFELDTDGSGGRAGLIVGPLPMDRKSTFLVSVADGVRSAVAPDRAVIAGQRAIAWDPAAKKVEIKAVRLQEGTSSFAVEVLCDDAASEGYRRWIWDEASGSSHRVSPRCLPEGDSALDRIQLVPDVPFTVSGSRGGFRIHAELERGPVTVVLGGGMQTVDGGLLTSPHQTELVVPALSQRVAFASKGRYLPKDGWKQLAIQHRNVDAVDVRVRHVPERNLVFWLTGDHEAADARTSDFVAKTAIPVRSEPDELVTSFVDVADLVSLPRPGVYEVEVAAGSARDAQRLLLTDLALVAKVPDTAPGQEWPEVLRVWTTGLRDAKPRRGVIVDAIRPSGKVMGTCTTDWTGGCLLRLPDGGDVDRTPPVALVARLGADVTYLKFEELKVDSGNADVGGTSWVDAPAYRAAMYTERGVYRPGETAHVAAVLRNVAHVAPTDDVPVDLELHDPRNRLVRKAEVRANAAGMFEWPVAFSDHAPTGRWRVVAKVGDREIGAVEVNVEAFVPERLDVAVDVPGDGYGPEDRVPVTTTARYLFGGSAEGSRWDLTCRVEPGAFRPAKHGNFTYGTTSDDARPVLLGTTSGTLGDGGVGTQECPAGALAGKLDRPGRIVAEVAVYEAGSGRTTVRRASTPLHPDRHYVGLTTGTQKAKAGVPVTIDGVVVDWAGDKTAAVTAVEIEWVSLQSEWGYRWDPQQGSERWMRYFRDVPSGRERVAVRDGAFRWTITPPDDAEAYEVRVRAGAARTDLRIEGSGRWWRWNDDGDQDATPRPLRPTTLALEVPAVAKVGVPVPVSFVAPYAGHALVTVETDRVLHHEWLEVKPGPVRWAPTVDAFVPNAYVSVLLLKDPHIDDPTAFLPDRAYGVASVKVDPEAFSLPIAVSVPDEVRSNAPLEVAIDLGTRAPSSVTVAVVDEGILSLTDHRTPDPLTALFPRRALGVTTYETVGWAVHLPGAGPSSAHGGDEDGGPPGKVQMVKPVSLWSGLVDVPDGGKATVTLDVPQYQGRLRVMVVGASGERTGAAEAKVVVRDPLVVQTTLPRFLVSGDEAEIPVFITNTSGKARDVELSMEAQWLDRPGGQADALAPISFVSADKAVLRLEDGASTTAVFAIRTLARSGAASLAITARSDELVSTEQLDVPFEPAGPRSRRSERIKLAKGAVDLAPHLKGWVPGTEETRIWVTNNPYGAAFTHLQHLVRYPYGCIEQTTSSTRPLLYVADLLGLADPGLVTKAEIDAKVAHGVERVLSMQTPAGGFSYWPGGTAPHPWGTAYASHMLLDARDAGYPVPEAALDRALDWLQRKVEERGTYTDLHHGTPSGEGYMLYVLGRSGRHRKARAERLLEGLGTPTTGSAREEAYLLQAALYLAGDRRHEAALRAADTSELSDQRLNDSRFYSDLRRRGFLLSVQHDLFGAVPEGEALARIVADGLARQQSARYSTQELVWGITGLGKRVAGTSASYQATLRAGGRDVVRDGGPGASQALWTLWRASERPELTLDVQDPGKGELFALVSSVGVREGEPWALGGSGLTVSRHHLDADGKPVSLQALELGDLVYVRIDVTNQTRERAQNLALVDRVPAGLEIENPRLGRGSVDHVVDADDLWTADHLDLFDDRLVVFGGIAPGETVSVVYAARAVTAGTFTLPPVEVDAMYDPGLWARAAGETVEISGPWEGSFL